MLNINNRSIAEIRIGEKLITSIYHGIKLIWSFSNSYFASDFEEIDEPKEEKIIEEKTIENKEIV